MGVGMLFQSLPVAVLVNSVQTVYWFFSLVVVTMSCKLPAEKQL